MNKIKFFERMIPLRTLYEKGFQFILHISFLSSIFVLEQFGTSNAFIVFLVGVIYYQLIELQITRILYSRAIVLVALFVSAFIFEWRILTILLAGALVSFTLKEFIQAPNRIQVRRNPPKARLTDFLWILIIIVLAILLRTVHIFDISLGLDEGIYHILLSNFREGAQLPELNSGALYLRGFIHTNLVRGLDLLFKDSLISTRLFSLGAGIFFVGYVYYFTYRYFSKITAIIASLFIAIHPYFIAYSNQGRHYMMNAIIYLAIVDRFILRESNRTKTTLGYTLDVFVISLAGLNYEFFFILIPIISFFGFKRKSRYLVGMSIYGFILFYIQYFYLTKSIGMTLDNINSSSKTLLSLNLFDPGHWLDSIQSGLSFSPFYLIILYTGFLFIREFISHKINRIFLLTLFSEVFFFSFLLDRGQLRYRQSAIILIIIFASYLIHFIFQRIPNQLGKIGFTTLLFCTFLSMPFYYTSKNYLSMYEVSEYFFTNKDAFFSEATDFDVAPYTDVVETVSYYRSEGYQVVSSDIYNLRYHVPVDYIMNDYLSEYITYTQKDSKQINYCVYSDTPFIKGEDILERIIQGERFIIVADVRFAEHNSSQEISQLPLRKVKTYGKQTKNLYRDLQLTIYEVNSTTLSSNISNHR